MNYQRSYCLDLTRRLQYIDVVLQVLTELIEESATGTCVY